ncbi:phage baseplate assembly protein V [Aliarcobacter cryaerophilus]|uniref:Phage baseplate assembly protein V n=2 Tax=unclassified Arcobacter TaxID=2593671 RepID=A0AA96CVK2_9BACT|nr:phage baseplate assembly protein V [Arcobacter sp. AZ-2023]WPD10343.1 phage baseplate assembly protein V [Arcobacter sp. DSM 115954]WNL15173.1 phage baseplate assembly protein V [Arcobacter sp. AZ-2023]WNL18945.1 phage baseplate assembly protein V [Arcobacter sp. AZ-2023]WNL21084.1 phage baseplate assembly protein V [Arcobacter sp. AZ-2023]
MLNLVELKRRLENIVQIGQISATKNQDGKALARVVVHDVGEDKRVTDFLPVISFANSFARVFFPIRAGEQVLVISLFGDANKGFILRSIFNKSCKEPDGASETKTIIEFEDGAILSYDTKSSTLEVLNQKTINVKVGEAVNVEVGKTVVINVGQSAKIVAPTVDIESTTTTIKSTKINLLGQTLIDGTLDITQNLSTGGNASIGGSISDSRGDLTNHTNAGHGRD